MAYCFLQACFINYEVSLLHKTIYQPKKYSSLNFPWFYCMFFPNGRAHLLNYEHMSTINAFELKIFPSKHY